MYWNIYFVDKRLKLFDTRVEKPVKEFYPQTDDERQNTKTWRVFVHSMSLEVKQSALSLVPLYARGAGITLCWLSSRQCQWSTCFLLSTEIIIRRWESYTTLLTNFSQNELIFCFSYRNENNLKEKHKTISKKTSFSQKMIGIVLKIIDYLKPNENLIYYLLLLYRKSLFTRFWYLERYSSHYFF